MLTCECGSNEIVKLVDRDDFLCLLCKRRYIPDLVTGELRTFEPTGDSYYQNLMWDHLPEPYKTEIEPLYSWIAMLEKKDVNAEIVITNKKLYDLLRKFEHDVRKEIKEIKNQKPDPLNG